MHVHQLIPGGARPHERVRINAKMGPAEVHRYCVVEPSAQPLLRAAAEIIAAPHLAEAQQYRLRVDVR